MQPNNVGEENESKKKKDKTKWIGYRGTVETNASLP